MDPVARLNAALQGRYRIEREIGEGGGVVHGHRIVGSVRESPLISRS